MSGEARNKWAIGWCELCRKNMFATRKLARRSASNHPQHKTPYRCPHNNLFWHIGRVPDEVVRGEMTKDEFFRGWWAAS